MTALLLCCASSNGDFATSGRIGGRNAATASPGQGLFGGGQRSTGREIFHDPNLGVADPFLQYDAGAAAEPSPPSQATSPSRPQSADKSSWIHPSVVRVRSEEDDGISNGSGTLIGVDEERGYIITNWHVVRGATGQVSVEFPDGFRSAATVMKTDAEWDLAILVIWKPNAPPMALSPHLPSPGEPLIIAGYGQGSFRSAQGTMTEFVAPSEDAAFEMFEVSTAARQGDSGGPIVNMQGQLAGVLFGAGDGRTTGSHVGRLRVFLDSAFQQQVADAQVADATPARTEAAQQPAAFHQEETEMDQLAREAVASLPDMPEIAEISVEIPGDPSLTAVSPMPMALPASPLPPAPVVATQPLPTASPYPQLASRGNAIGVGGATGDVLSGIPFESPPHEYGLPTGTGYGYSDTYATSRYRGGSAFGDLKTFFTLFGIFAVVFMMLPRDRS